MRDTWPLFSRRISEYETLDNAPDLSTPTPDRALINLERQGFRDSDAHNTWRQKLDTELRNKVSFDLSPTNPQADIKPTGHCEFWTHNIDLVRYRCPIGPTQNAEQAQHPISQPLTLPEIYNSRVTCILNTQGKCTGMLTPERMNILHMAYQKASQNGMHAHIFPPPTSVASELRALVTRHDQLKYKFNSKVVTDSFSRSLPDRVHAALQKWALVTQEKMASPLDFHPGYQNFWSAYPRDAVFGAHHDCLTSKFSGFSVCHPIYDEHSMTRTLRHAIYSAIHNSDATATFMFLPSWRGPMNTNPYSKLLLENPQICCKIGTFPRASLTYNQPQCWISQKIPLPDHSWNLELIAVWNTAALVHLNTNNQNWLRGLDSEGLGINLVQLDIKAAPLPPSRRTTQLPGINPFLKLPWDVQQISYFTDQTRSAPAFTEVPDRSRPELSLKIPNWRSLAYTDGSCYTEDSKQITGAGVYHPETHTSNRVDPNGEGITNTISRAELTAIAAAMIHNHGYIATDSLTSLHQIRKQILYPEKHRYHIQGDVLNTIIAIIRNSALKIYFFKVKSHAGIAGNECADVIAKYQAIHQNDSPADTGILNAGPDGNPFTQLAWLAVEQQPSNNGSSPAAKYLPNLRDALKNQMHTGHKLGQAKTDTGYYTFYQGLLPLVDKTISNAFWNMPYITHPMKRNIFQYRTGTLYNQKHAVRFKRSTNLSCPLCHQNDSALHILSGCQHPVISKIITERHNIAGRLIMSAIKRHSCLGRCIVSLDIGSEQRLAQHNLQLPDQASNRFVPDWLFNPNIRKDARSTRRPDAILVTPITSTTSNHSRVLRSAANNPNERRGELTPIKHPQDLAPHRRHIHLVEIKYCEDTRPGNQLAAAQEQHRVLNEQLEGGQITLHTILLGVGGSIYIPHTLKQLTALGLNLQKAKKVARKLHSHCVHYAHKLITSRRTIEMSQTSNQGLGSGANRHPPDPH